MKHCLLALRPLLSARYAIFPITDTVILKEPWTASCALLIFPGGADLGYCRALNGEGNRRIMQYVRRGGSYMGFCAGGYYGSARCEFEVGNKELEVVGSRELAFFPGTCRGGAFRGFVYHSESGARATQLQTAETLGDKASQSRSFRCYSNGGGVFVDAEKLSTKGVEILARYTEQLDVDGGDGTAAAIYCKVGAGHCILTGTHPE